MNDIRVEDVEGVDDKRQPIVTVIPGKTQAGIGSQTQLKDNKSLEKIADKSHEEEKIISENHKDMGVQYTENPEQNPEELHLHRSQDEQPRDRAETGVAEIVRIEPLHSSRVLEKQLESGKVFKKVLPRGPYKEKETYRSVASAASLRTLRRSAATNKSKQSQKDPKKKEKVAKRTNIFDKLPGLIDFGFTQEEEIQNLDISISATEENPYEPDINFDNKHSSTNLRNSLQISKMQEQIAKRVELRQSASRRRRLEQYLEKKNKFQHIFHNKRKAPEVVEQLPTQQSKALPSKAPTEKQRSKAIDFTEKHRFRIKRNKLQNCIYGKPVQGWGITAGKESPEHITVK